MQITPKQLLLERLNYRQSQLNVAEEVRELATKIYLIGADCDKNYTEDYMTKLTDFWLNRDCNAELVWLPRFGITGNGHMMIEDNSKAIIQLICKIALL